MRLTMHGIREYLVTGHLQFRNEGYPKKILQLFAMTSNNRACVNSCEQLNFREIM